MRIAVNTRVLHMHTTGVQRYTLELLSRLGREVRRIAPAVKLDGVQGHLWEQAILPLRIGDRLLWSPSNTGPIAVRRQVVTIHDVVPLDHPEWLNPRFAAWYRWLLPRLAKRVAHIITISEFSRQRIVECLKVAATKVTVIPNGVDARFHPRSPTEVTRTRRGLGIPSPHYILTVGSLEPRKNLHRLLQAWERVHTSIPDDVWLVVTGAKGKALVFKDVHFSKLPPRVHLTGHVEDAHLPALYSGALAFAYLSVYEGFGLPPLEAMAAGVPTITGNRTALPEVVGDAGVMVDPLDVDAIADGLKRIVEDSDLRRQLRAKGLERARRFSWDRTAALTFSVLEASASQC